VRFSVGFADADIAKEKCLFDFKSIDPRFGQRYEKGARREIRNSAGILAPASWTHRKFIIGASGSVTSCKINIIVRFNDVVVERSVDIPNDVYYILAPTAEPRNIDVSTIAEKIIGSNESFIRTFVRNNGSKISHIMVIDRNLQCAEYSSVRWPVWGGTVQGTNSGPITLAPSEWIVFVNLLEEYESAGFGKPNCSGAIVVGGLDDSYDVVEIKRSEFRYDGSENNAYIDLTPQ